MSWRAGSQRQTATAASAATAPAIAKPMPSASVNAAPALAPPSRLDVASDVMSEPITAVPSAPPTWRVTSFIAEATPAFSSGTAPITASVAGPAIQPSASARAANQSPIGR